MKMLRFPVVVAVALGPAALGQTQTATYSLRFANGTSAISLHRGQATTVDLYVSFEPGPGNTAVNPPLSGPALGLSDGAFDIVGQAPAGVSGSWTVDANMLSSSFALPNPWGAQGGGGIGSSVGGAAGLDVDNVYWGYALLLATAHPFPQNPAKIWRATFTVGTASVPGQIQFIVDPRLDTGVFAGPSAAGAIPFVAVYEAAAVPASVTVLCYADCNGSGTVTIADFACFQGAFAAGNMYADCNGSGTLTIADFACMQAVFPVGCP